MVYLIVRRTVQTQHFLPGRSHSSGSVKQPETCTQVSDSELAPVKLSPCIIVWRPSAVNRVSLFLVCRARSLCLWSWEHPAVCWTFALSLSCFLCSTPIRRNESPPTASMCPKSPDLASPRNGTLFLDPWRPSGVVGRLSGRRRRRRPGGRGR